MIFRQVIACLVKNEEQKSMQPFTKAKEPKVLEIRSAYFRFILSVN